MPVSSAPTGLSARATQAGVGAAVVAAAIILALNLPAASGADANVEIGVGANPLRLVQSKDHQRLYVANSGTNTVSAIDIGQNRKVGDIVVGEAPSDLAIAPDGSALFTVNAKQPSVSIITLDGGAPRVQDPIAIPGSKTSSHISVLARKVSGHEAVFAYVSNVYSGHTPEGLPLGSVSVIDLAKRTIVKDIRISPAVMTIGCAEGSDVTPDGQRLYVNTQCRAVSNFSQDPIFVIDTQSEAVTDMIDFTAARRPNVGTGLAVRPDGKQVWAAGGDACTAPWPTYDKSRCGPPGGNPVTVIDPATKEFVKQLFYGAPEFIAFSADSRIAYLATPTNILAIDCKTFEVVAELPVAGSSGSMVFTDDGRYAYTPIPSRGVVVRVALPSIKTH